MGLKITTTRTKNMELAVRLVHLWTLELVSRIRSSIRTSFTMNIGYLTNMKTYVTFMWHNKKNYEVVFIESAECIVHWAPELARCSGTEVILL